MGLQDVIDISIKKRAMLQRQLAALENASDVTDEQREMEAWEIRRQIIAATRTIARAERKKYEQ